MSKCTKKGESDVQRMTTLSWPHPRWAKPQKVSSRPALSPAKWRPMEGWSLYSVRSSSTQFYTVPHSSHPWAVCIFFFPVNKLSHSFLSDEHGESKRRFVAINSQRNTTDHGWKMAPHSALGPRPPWPSFSFLCGSPWKNPSLGFRGQT